MEQLIDKRTSLFIQILYRLSRKTQILSLLPSIFIWLPYLRKKLFILSVLSNKSTHLLQTFGSLPSYLSQLNINLKNDSSMLVESVRHVKLDVFFGTVTGFVVLD